MREMSEDETKKSLEMLRDYPMVWCAKAGVGKTALAAEIAASQGLKYTTVNFDVPDRDLPSFLRRGRYRAHKPWELEEWRGTPLLNFQRLLLYLDILSEIEPCALQFKRKLQAQQKAQRAGFPELVRELAKDLKLIAYHLRRIGRL